MKLKRILCSALLLACLFVTTAYAAGSGDVAGTIESTWKDASSLIKAVVKKVVFPAVDLILAVVFLSNFGLYILILGSMVSLNGPHRRSYSPVWCSH